MFSTWASTILRHPPTFYMNHVPSYAILKVVLCFLNGLLSLLLLQFSPDEADRIVRRRERNKVAATKCRHKRREQHEELVKVKRIPQSPNLNCL